MGTIQVGESSNKAVVNIAVGDGGSFGELALIYGEEDYEDYDDDDDYMMMTMMTMMTMMIMTMMKMTMMMTMMITMMAMMTMMMMTMLTMMTLGTPRAATVRANTDMKLWGLARLLC